MIRTMARVTDVHQLEDEDDGVELPAKIVNEDLRRFFMPKKYAEPEPVQKIAPEAEKVQEKQFEEPANDEAQGTQETEGLNRPVGAPEKEPVKEEEKSTAVPVELLRKSEQHAQSPKSAYARGAFDPRAPQAPVASPAKKGSSWWRLGSRKSRMGKESSPAKVAPAQSVRFLEKHNPYSQPSAKQLLDGEQAPQPTPAEAHAVVDPAAPEPATAEVAPADAEVAAPDADKEGLEAAVTPAAVDSTAASGEPIAEAVVALQEVMEPAPVPEPVLEDEAVKEGEFEDATAVPAEEEDNMVEEPVQAVHEAPVEATAHKKEVSAAEEVGPVEATAHKEEGLPVEAPAQQERMTEAEVAAPLDAITEKVLPETAQPEEPAAQELPSAPVTEAEAVHEEEKAGYYHEQAQEDTHHAQPEQAQLVTEEPAAEVAAPAVEEPVSEAKAAERKAITMSMTLNEEIEGAEAEHRPVSCKFVVDEDALPSIPETAPMSTQSSPQKEMPINDWYKKGDRKASKKGRGFFSRFDCFSA